MDEEEKSAIFPAIYGEGDSLENLEAFLQKEGYSNNQSNESPVLESPVKYISLIQSKTNYEDSKQTPIRNNRFHNLTKNPEDEDETMYEDNYFRKREEEKESNTGCKIKIDNNSKYPSTFTKSNYIGKFNLPSIVNSTRQS